MELRLLVPIHQRIPRRPIQNPVSGKGRYLTEIAIVSLVEASGLDDGYRHGGVGGPATGESEACGAPTYNHIVVGSWDTGYAEVGSKEVGGEERLGVEIGESLLSECWRR